MNGLFIRIFGWFWLTIIITITATYWISSSVFDSGSQHPQLNEVIDHYLEDIEHNLTTRTLTEFLDWLGIQRFPRGIGVVLLDEQGSIITAKGIPKAVVQFYQQHKSWPFESGKHFRLEQKTITTDQTLQLSVLLLPKKKHFRSDHPPPWFSNFNKRTRGWGIIRLVIALAVSALVCYLLARYLSRPITKLRNTVNSLGKGNFDTDIAAQFVNRKDEISELAIDIDEMAAKLREQFRIREDLLRDISHELRSPLARMRIASELIKSKTPELKLKEITQLESDIVLIDNLIGEILTFSRLSDKNRQYELDVVDIRAVLDDILENANFEAASQNKQVILNCNSTVSYELNANKALIQRAMENIIRNAIKYTQEQTLVTIDLQRQADLISVTVKDQGPGVAKDHLEKIFEPFYRVSDSRSRESGGSGLGLAITRRAIELHNGTIAARNSDSGGLIISVELPVIHRENTA